MSITDVIDLYQSITNLYQSLTCINPSLTFINRSLTCINQSLTCINHWPISIKHWPTSLNHWPTSIKHWPTWLNHWPTSLNHWPTSLNHWPVSCYPPTPAAAAGWGGRCSQCGQSCCWPGTAASAWSVPPGPPASAAGWRTDPAAWQTQEQCLACFRINHTLRFRGLHLACKPGCSNPRWSPQCSEDHNIFWTKPKRT